MLSIKIQKGAFLTTIFGCIQFVVLTTIAMILYPGGTYLDSNAPRYDFIRNFFSDLGRTIAINGELNIVSRALFTTALLIAGLTLIGLFALTPYYYKEKKSSFWLSIVGSINGIICALAYIGIGFAPSDLEQFLTAHIYFVYIAFTGTLLTLILYTIATFIVKEVPNFYAWVYIACVFISLTYLVILYGGDIFSLLSGTIIQAIGQKVIVYVEIITFMIQAVGLYRIANKTIKNKSNNQEVIN
ncbi:MAG: DUF998 domain-containing protein [Asgard group archaeon]|nr:DUF998 domain-containing protein [Asgard group archaeon]